MSKAHLEICREQRRKANARIGQLEAEINAKADWNMKAFERIEQLEAVAEEAKDLLWKMQNGEVLEYSKPMIGKTIASLSKALGEVEC